MWFTDFRYLNDLSELKYGVNLFKEALARVEAQRTSNLTLIVSEIRNHFDEALTYTDQFVLVCALRIICKINGAYTGEKYRSVLS